MGFRTGVRFSSSPPITISGTTCRLLLLVEMRPQIDPPRTRSVRMEFAFSPQSDARSRGGVKVKNLRRRRNSPKALFQMVEMRIQIDHLRYSCNKKGSRPADVLSVVTDHSATTSTNNYIAKFCRCQYFRQNNFNGCREARVTLAESPATKEPTE